MVSRVVLPHDHSDEEEAVDSDWVTRVGDRLGQVAGPTCQTGYLSYPVDYEGIALSEDGVVWGSYRFVKEL